MTKKSDKKSCFTPTVCIPKFEYEALLAANDRLNALEKVGVYGWPGYESALRTMIEKTEEQQLPA